MTLTFLILAGQVKVKGQLGEMAKCVEDSDERLRDMSRMFFAELAGKDNAVYNHFVDMFSLLSADEGLEEDRFRRMIKFLASFIEKVSNRTVPEEFRERCEVGFTNTASRTSTPSSSRASWRLDCSVLRASGSGMMSRMRLGCFRIRTRRLLRWLGKDVRWSRRLHDYGKEHMVA